MPNHEPSSGPHGHRGRGNSHVVRGCLAIRNGRAVRRILLLLQELKGKGAECGREKLRCECYSFTHSLTHGSLLNPSWYLSGRRKQTSDPHSSSLQVSGCG